jgi:hypothetical protein
MEYLLGLVGSLLALLFYTKSKKDSAEALLENSKAQAELNAVEKDKAKNDGLLEAEEQKRKEALAQNEKDKQNDSKQSNLDYFNNK